MCNKKIQDAVEKENLLPAHMRSPIREMPQLELMYQTYSIVPSTSTKYVYMLQHVLPAFLIGFQNFTDVLISVYTVYTLNVVKS